MDKLYDIDQIKSVVILRKIYKYIPSYPILFSYP